MLAIAAAIVAAFGNSLDVPFLLDDHLGIVENPTLEPGAPATAVLFPPAHIPTGGRPLLNLSFAFNHALTGTRVWSYHAVNLFIHFLAACTLFGIVRATLARVQPELGARTIERLAVAAALLWCAHPLQPASVTYLSQRAESLAGLFYLSTIYFFIRSTKAGNPRLWRALSVFALVCGVATKEIVATAPLIVLLYDRAFIENSLRRILALRGRYYGALAATWLLLGALMVSTDVHQRIKGDLRQTVSPWSYALTESRVVVDYGRLAAWPSPLVFDYGGEILVGDVRAVIPFIAIVLCALVVTVLLWRLSKPAAFLASAFFLILAPTSSVIPVALQPMAESRMYLPLAAIVIGIVVLPQRVLGGRTWAPLGVLCVASVLLAHARNHTFRTPLALWTDTVAKQPGSSRAYNNLGSVLRDIPGREEEAVAHLQTALRIKPDFAEPHMNLGQIRAWQSRHAEALEHYRTAAWLVPHRADAHANLAAELARQPGRLAEAIAHYEEALRRRPEFPEAHNNLGNLLARIPARHDEAMAHYQQAIARRPHYATAHNNLANLLATMPERTSEAIRHYHHAIASNPNYDEAHANLAVLYAKLNRRDEAVRQYSRALEIDPSSPVTHYNYANLLRLMGETDEAVAHYEDALTIEPSFAPAMMALAEVMSVEKGDDAQALRWLRAALQLEPASGALHFNLGVLLLRAGEEGEAASHFERAERLDPSLSSATRAALARIDPRP